MVRIGVIGFGYWGPNILRNFSGLESVEVKYVCDLNEGALKRAQRAYPGVSLTTCSRDITRAADVDAVAIITPVATHYELAREALENGKHVFVEKPFTYTVDEAKRLIEIAEKKSLRIMIDHTFLFTGAVRNSKGLFAQTDGGTLFLDEIGDMPLSLQAKLLRVLQERQFYPLGSEKPLNVDIRLIVATNKDLEAEVRKGSFREDLFYRVHVIPVRIPPLRERREDIIPLAEHFLRKTSEKMKKEVKGLTPLAIQKLMLHDWPGNVRELENAIEYAVVTSRSEVIADEAILPFRETLSASPKPFKEAKEDFEKEYLNWVLQIAEGNVSKAAGMAGKYRADFYSLLRKYDLKPEDFKKT